LPGITVYTGITYGSNAGLIGAVTSNN